MAVRNTTQTSERQRPLNHKLSHAVCLPFDREDIHQISHEFDIRRCQSEKNRKNKVKYKEKEKKTKQPSQ